FRMFHNYKATTAYLGISVIHEVVTKTENVLSALRVQSAPANEAVVEWLLEVKDQFDIWQEEMRDGLTNFSAYKTNLLDFISISKSCVKPSQRIKELNLIYFDYKNERSKRVVPAINKVVKSVLSINSLDKLELISKKVDSAIYLINADEDNYKAAQLVANNAPKSAIIVIFDKINKQVLLKLGRVGVNHTITNPIKGSDLKRELLTVTESHFSERRLFITNKKIHNFIKKLDPLPSTISQVTQICDDEDKHINDLVKVVKSDSIFSATVLQAANDPIYGLKKVATIDQAVSIFGKKTIKAFAMTQLKESLGKIDLEAYAIDEKIFSKVSALRLSLMLKWYSKVSISALNILTSTAILGNLGQLLLSKEIKEFNKIDEFKRLFESEQLDYAEAKLINTTTAYVTSDILKFWNLNSNIIDSIKYSENLHVAPLEIRNLCVANYIVYKLIDHRGVVAQELSEDILALLAQEGLDSYDLEKALAFVNEKLIE
ncbi:MAG: HDOD domain-containing protein, partial [Campylobacterota bacterium]|nr:HDOD domain-containing protein [Campylobacterota bacterium]